VIASEARQSSAEPKDRLPVGRPARNAGLPVIPNRQAGSLSHHSPPRKDRGRRFLRVATGLLSRQSVDHADIGSGIASHHAVGLEGDEPALISALSGNSLAFQRVVCIVPIFEGLEIDRYQHVAAHEWLIEDGEGFAAFVEQVLNNK